MKKAIITGPTGAIGMALIRVLREQGLEVTAVCHKGSKRIQQIPQESGVQVIACDLDEIQNLGQILPHDYDIFYHLAWAGTVGNARNDIPSQIKNIQYTIDAVETAKVIGCQSFVGAGSQAEYGRSQEKLNAQTQVFPENGYGMAKLCAGQMSRLRCEQLGIRHIWTRILSVYGPYDGERSLVSSMLQKLLHGEKVSCTKGEQIWDYIYSEDAARALYAVGKFGCMGKTYCIGSGEGKPLAEYIKQIRDTVSPRDEIGFGDLPYGDKQVMYLCADISELTEDTGFVPKVGFEEGIRKTLKWYKEQTNEKNQHHDTLL